MAAIKASKMSSGVKVKTSSLKPLPTFKSEEFIEDSDEMSEDENPPPKHTVKSKQSEKAATVLSEKCVPPKTTKLEAQKLKKTETPSSPAQNSESECSLGSFDGNGIRSASRKRSTPGSGSKTEDGTPTATHPEATSKPRTAAKSILKPSSDTKASATKVPPRRSSVRWVGQEDSDEESPKSSSDGDRVQQGESGSESESLSESGEEREHGRMSGPATPSQTPFPPYRAPIGFEAATISFTPESGIDEVFMPSNLESKQIWYITTPASVPINLVKQVSAQSITDGSCVLTHKSADYGLVPDAGDNAKGASKRLLIPQVQDNEYRPVEISIEKTLHLQQLIKLPSHVGTSPNAANSMQGPLEHSRKPPNEQPKGLKMRHHAFGIPGAFLSDSASDISNSESATSRQPPPSHLPDIATGPSPSKKRKRAELAGISPDAQGSPSKSKMRKDRSKISPRHEDIDMDINATIAPTTNPIKKTKHMNKADEVSALATVTLSKEEAKEDRAKRKAEKHKAKLLEPFNVSRSASPTDKALTNGNHMNGESVGIKGHAGIIDDDDDSQVTAGRARISQHNDAAAPLINGKSSKSEDALEKTSARISSPPTESGPLEVRSAGLDDQET